MKCLGISLIKYLQNLHTENHTILTKEIKVNKWYNIQCLRIEKLYWQEVSSFQCDLQIQNNTNPCKLFGGYLQTDSKILQRGKNPQ